MRPVVPTFKTFLAALFCALLVPGAATAENFSWTEGETGHSFTCSGMAATNTPGASGGQTLYFPADGCAATYTMILPVRVVTVEFYVDGAAFVCGHFEFRGASVGESATACGAPGTKLTAAATTTVGSGTSLVVEWHTDSGTSITADAYLDRFSWT